MKRHIPSFNPIALLLVLATALGLQACALYPTAPQERLKELELIVKAYNNSFESRHPSGGVTYVRDDLKPNYLMKYAQLKDKVTFGRTQRINQALYKNDELVPLTEQVLQAEEPPFNKAIITMRYEIVVKPSNQVKTLVHDQEWELTDGRWILVPDLDPFMK
jgi:hypothetical protein